MLSENQLKQNFNEMIEDFNVQITDYKTAAMDYLDSYDSDDPNYEALTDALDGLMGCQVKLEAMTFIATYYRAKMVGLAESCVISNADDEDEEVELEEEGLPEVDGEALGFLIHQQPTNNWLPVLDYPPVEEIIETFRIPDTKLDEEAVLEAWAESYPIVFVTGVYQRKALQRELALGETLHAVFIAKKAIYRKIKELSDRSLLNEAKPYFEFMEQRTDRQLKRVAKKRQKRKEKKRRRRKKRR